MQTDNIDITLNQKNISALAFLGQIQAEEQPALVVNRSFFCVEIFGFSISDDSAGKTGDVSSHINNRKDKPVAEGIITPAVFSFSDQVGAEKLLLGITFFKHGSFQGIPAFRSIPEAKGSGGS